MNTFFGLPAHPLLVHIPVVLIPLLTIGVIAIAVRPDWREKHLRWMAVLGLLVMVATVAAASAGEYLEARVGDTPQLKTHTDLGGQTEAFMIAFGIVLALAALAQWRSAVTAKLARYVAPLVIVAAVAGTVTSVWVTRTGHAGAKSVWDETPKQPLPGKSGG